MSDPIEIFKKLDGFAACNLAEPSAGDLERIYTAYKECHARALSLELFAESLSTKCAKYEKALNQIAILWHTEYSRTHHFEEMTRAIVSEAIAQDDNSRSKKSL